MANLQSTSTTSLTVDGSTVWTAANSGSTGGINADRLAGYNINHFHNTRRLQYLNLRSDSSYDANTYYPMVIAGNQTDKWVTELDVRRTSVHQDGSSFGAFFGTFRYRANGWNFWEVKENWGSGSRYPFAANMAVSATDNKAAVWLRGNLTYYYRFNNDDEFVDTSPNSGKAFGNTTVSPTTSVNLASSSAMLQHSLCSQGYNLGASSDGRWGTVFTVNAINASSDARFKADIQDSPLGLEFVKRLQPKSYKLKPLPHWSEEMIEKIDTRRYHGLVAQDVKQALEDEGFNSNECSLVNSSDDKVWSIGYDQLVPICVKAVQEQWDTIDSIEERLARLEAV